MNHIVRNLRQLVETDDAIYPGQKTLKLHGKHLIDVPSEVSQLAELEVLLMSPEREACLFYRLQEIPPWIGRLNNLKVLRLDTNSLCRIPPEIGTLIKLERLSLSNNLLNRLPEEMGNLENLKSLHLANNQFLTFPDIIVDIRSLQSLDISSNRIATIPSDIKALGNLEALFLNSNVLRKLPEEIGELRRLKILWLGNNLIASLPPSLWELKYLNWSVINCPSATLDGNPLRHPPLDVCKGGITQMKDFARTSKTDTVNTDNAV